MEPVATHVELHVEVAPSVTLRAIEWGAPAAERPSFLLVHGLASNALMWDGVGRRLAKAGHHAIAVDQRGHGHSSKPDSGYDFATITADLVALLDHVGLDDAIWVGQSWGGNVVVEAAATHSTRVRGVVAVDGGTIELADRFATWEECAAALRPPRLTGMRYSRIEAGIRAANPDWPEEGIAGSLANFEILADGLVRPWLSLEHHMAILHALYDHHPSALFERIERPVMLVIADSGSPPETSIASAKRAAVATAARSLATSRAVWFSPAHHDLHAEQPDRLTATLLGALDEGFFG